jgi:hypothetical protein
LIPGGFQAFPVYNTATTTTTGGTSGGGVVGGGKGVAGAAAVGGGDGYTTDTDGSVVEDAPELAGKDEESAPPPPTSPRVPPHWSPPLQLTHDLAAAAHFELGGMETLASSLLHITPESLAVIHHLHHHSSSSSTRIGSSAQAQAQGQEEEEEETPPPSLALERPARSCLREGVMVAACSDVAGFMASAPPPDTLLAVVRRLAKGRHCGRVEVALAQEAGLGLGEFRARQAQGKEERVGDGERDMMEKLGLKFDQVPWGSAIALVATFLLFLAMAEFNTALSGLVPVINISFILILAVCAYLGYFPL